MRPERTRFFALAQYPVRWPPRELSKALDRSFQTFLTALKAGEIILLKSVGLGHTQSSYFLALHFKYDLQDLDWVHKARRRVMCTSTGLLCLRLLRSVYSGQRRRLLLTPFTL